MLTHLSGKFGPELEEFRKDSWIDHITDLFDRQLRVDRSN
jgi:hypothetical protein